MHRHSVCVGRLAVVALASLLSLKTIGAQAAPPAARTPQSIVDEVWTMEESYWSFVKAGDVENYLTLWNKDFRGWPCADEHPATKTSISDWVRDIRDRKVKFSSALTREGASSVGGIVVVYYRTPMTYAYPDGHTEILKTPAKFTHTWMKTNGRWEIIGGMCGADAPRITVPKK